MTTDNSILAKKDLVLDKERQFCSQVSAAILDKPQLAVWMILIPVFFVFYFWQLKRYSEGRKDFAANFLITRESALSKACDAAVNRGEPKIEELADAEDVPQQAREQYRNWLELLSRHYLKLITGRGKSYTELVRSAYGSKKKYVQFYEELNRAEREFNAALQPHLDLENSEVVSIVKKIETITVKLRRQEVQEIFS